MADCDVLLQYLPSNTHLADLYWVKVATFAFNALLSLTSAVLNIVTTQAIRKTLSLPGTLRTLLLSLAGSDLGVALLGQPLYLVFLATITQSNGSRIHCTAKFAFVIIMGVFISASFLGIVALSLDRFLAILLHLRYASVVTYKRAVAAVVFVWVFSALRSPVTFLWLDSGITDLVSLAIGFICLAGTSFVYFRIFLVVRRQKKQTRTQLQQVVHNGEVANLTSARRSSLNTFFIFLAFLFCYLPQFCCWIIINIYGPGIALNNWLFVTWTLVFLNSSLNPVVYCWRMRNIRRAVVDVLRNMSLSSLTRNWKDCKSPILEIFSHFSISKRLQT